MKRKIGTVKDELCLKGLLEGDSSYLRTHLAGRLVDSVEVYFKNILADLWNPEYELIAGLADDLKGKFPGNRRNKNCLVLKVEVLQTFILYFRDCLKFFFLRIICPEYLVRSYHERQVPCIVGIQCRTRIGCKIFFSLAKRCRGQQ